VFEPASMSNPPPSHVASPPHTTPYSTNPPPSPHVSQAIEALDTMFTSGTAAHLDDIDRKTFDSSLLLTFVSDIVGLDRGSTFGSRDIDASGSGFGPS
jgi:hypothetical protein